MIIPTEALLQFGILGPYSLLDNNGHAQVYYNIETYVVNRMSACDAFSVDEIVHTAPPQRVTSNTAQSVLTPQIPSQPPVHTNFNRSLLTPQHTPQQMNIDDDDEIWDQLHRWTLICKVITSIVR